MIKKYLSIACVCGLLIGLAGVAADREVYQIPQEEPKVEVYVPTAMEKYEEALSKGTDLRFWYDDASYDTYFKTMAAKYVPSAILYPLTSGASIVLSALMAAVFFKERITPKCVIGIIIAIAAIVIMNF